MTGVQQVLAAGKGSIQSPTAVLLDVKTGATANCQINLLPDGTITFTGTGSSCVPASWYIPTTAAIGNSYWAKLTGTGLPSGSSGVNTVLPIGPGGLSWSQIRNSLGSTTGTWTITFYTDAAGASPVGVFTFNATATWQ